jgi:hypothetical protein
VRARAVSEKKEKVIMAVHVVLALNVLDLIISSDSLVRLPILAI